jgi:adenylate kinase family enzyme
MRRVLVMGNSGSGKSTFARALGARTGLPVTHLDQIFWEPGWVQAPKEQYVARLDAVLVRDAWIIDGTNSTTLDRRIPRADTIVWLKRWRVACCRRIAWRVLTSYGQVRPDMAQGCPEQVDWEFMKYVWSFDAKYEPRIIAALDRHDAWRRTVILKSDGETASYLRGLPRAA